jgi:MFS family permease
LCLSLGLIGCSATVALVILRLLQGLAVGGELVGAYIYTLEATNGVNRGFWGACTKATGNFGTALGKLLCPRFAMVQKNLQVILYVGCWM